MISRSPRSAPPEKNEELDDEPGGLKLADICACIADLLRWLGERLIRAAKDGASELKD
jgi:hypothetical protein